MADDGDDLLDGDDWNPFEVVEESREKLEALADARRQAEAREFPRHLLTSDPVWARGVVQRSRAEKQAEKEAKATIVVPAPEVPARLATEEEIASCRSAKTMLAKMAKAGWTAEAHFMRGPAISGRKVLGIRELLVIRAGMPDDGRSLRIIWERATASDEPVDVEEGEEPPSLSWKRRSGWAWTPEAQQTWTKAGTPAVTAYMAPPEPRDVQVLEP